MPGHRGEPAGRGQEGCGSARRREEPHITDIYERHAPEQDTLPPGRPCQSRVRIRPPVWGPQVPPWSRAVKQPGLGTESSWPATRAAS